MPNLTLYAHQNLVICDTFSSHFSSLFLIHFRVNFPSLFLFLKRNRKITETMSRSELMNDDQQQPLPQQPTITPASIDKGESPMADLPFSPASPVKDQQQQPTIIAATINSGESHVATMLAIVPYSSAPPLSSVSANTSKKRRGRPLGSRNKIQSKKSAYGNSLFLFSLFFFIDYAPNQPF